LKFEKPGVKKKQSNRIGAPKSPECAYCGLESETCCYRHSESRIIKFLDGGGIMGGKINNRLTGLLCFDCDAILSEPLTRTATIEQEESHALKWAMAIIRTWLL